MVKQMRNQVAAITDLAVHLKLTIPDLYTLCTEGKVPGQKIGRRGRFQRAVIDHWLGCGANHPTCRSSR
jgi:hypothetical protein